MSAYTWVYRGVRKWAHWDHEMRKLIVTDRAPAIGEFAVGAL